MIILETVCRIVTDNCREAEDRMIFIADPGIARSMPFFIRNTVVECHHQQFSFRTDRKGIVGIRELIPVFFRTGLIAAPAVFNQKGSVLFWHASPGGFEVLARIIIIPSYERYRMIHADICGIIILAEILVIHIVTVSAFTRFRSVCLIAHHQRTVLDDCLFDEINRFFPHAGVFILLAVRVDGVAGRTVQIQKLLDMGKGCRSFVFRFMKETIRIPGTQRFIRFLGFCQRTDPCG